MDNSSEVWGGVNLLICVFRTAGRLCMKNTLLGGRNTVEYKTLKKAKCECLGIFFVYFGDGLPPRL